MIPAPSQPPVPLGYSELVSLTVSLYGLYRGDNWPVLAQLLQAVYAGDADAVAKILSEPAPPPTPGYDNYPDADAAITCADTDNPRDPHRYGHVGRLRDATVAPYAGSRWANLALTCATWHGRATERYAGPWSARTRNPVLVIGNRYDPATPYRNAVKVSRLLPNSTLLSVDGVGHASLLTSSCATALTAQYLLTGAAPAAGTVCRQDRAPFDPVPATVPGEGGPLVRDFLLSAPGSTALSLPSH
jgi:pimeloyl-ACP methyl ester carboxylesterase